MTYNYYEIIFNICSLSIEKGTWIELGCHGAHLTTRMVGLFNKAIAVDIEKRFSGGNFIFYNESTDNFFNHFNEKADAIFIDADHHFESVKKDFENSLKILNKSGIIFIHDTDPISHDYLREDRCIDSYKIIDWIKDNYKDLDILTLPVDEAGLTLVRRNSDRRVLELI